MFAGMEYGAYAATALSPGVSPTLLSAIEFWDNSRKAVVVTEDLPVHLLQIIMHRRPVDCQRTNALIWPIIRDWRIR